MRRAHGRGGPIVLWEARGAPHPAAARRRLAPAWPMARRCLPTATPARHALDPLGRHGTGRALAHRPVASLEAAAEHACGAILTMRRHDRLRQAGVLSGHFWL